MEFEVLPVGWALRRLGDKPRFDLIMGHSPGSSSTYNEQEHGLLFFLEKADFGEVRPTPRVYCSAPARMAEANHVLISVRAPVAPINPADRRCVIGR